MRLFSISSKLFDRENTWELWECRKGIGVCSEQTTSRFAARARKKTVRDFDKFQLQFQTFAEVAHTFESLRRFRGRFESTKSIPGSNAGAASGGKGALQFCRAVVAGIDFPAWRHHICSTSGGQELVRRGVQRDDRTLPLQLCRGDCFFLRSKKNCCRQ